MLNKLKNLVNLFKITDSLSDEQQKKYAESLFISIFLENIINKFFNTSINKVVSSFCNLNNHYKNFYKKY